MGDQVIIKTKLGKLKGRIRNSALSNRKYYSFQGIPFGKPPTGQMRFKAPQPFGGWEGVREALEDGPVCVQPALFTRLDETDLSQPVKLIDGDEDCLYLNIYTNKHPEKAESKRPVMVSIHGGGFMGGSGCFRANGPEYLVEGDVVLVFINYRCGPFGFLSLDTEEVPGNAGLKDQILALKWVQDNIDSFGGDPNNVTIFGISAGGASVHYHMVSPLSKGLFHKAIIQSGYGQSLWAFQHSPKKVAVKIAKKLGCDSEDPEKILQLLQAAPPDHIMGACLQIVGDKDHIMCCSFVFSPSVEVAGSERFLPDTVSNLLRTEAYTKVPTILGIGQNEGTLQNVYLLSSQQKKEELITTINENPEILVPHFLGLKPGSLQENEVKKSIWDFYLKGKPLTLDNFQDYINLHSDLQFNVGFGETRNVLVETSASPTYSYLFTNHSRCMCKTSLKPGGHSKSDEGTCHAADGFFYYTSVCGLRAPEVTAQAREAIMKHIETWVKFASYGDPNGEELGVRWERDSQSRPCHMDMGTVWTMREGVPFADRINFWQQLSQKYCKDKK